MDKNKHPGISFDNIILRELNFSRKPEYSERPDLQIILESSISFSNDNEKLTYELTCMVTDKNELLSIKCSMIGFFSVINGQENMSLKDYSEVNAPAAIFPYLRESISSITTKAGLLPIIIPPTNIAIIKAKINDEV